MNATCRCVGRIRIALTLQFQNPIKPRFLTWSARYGELTRVRSKWIVPYMIFIYD